MNRHSQSKWIIGLASIDWSRPDIVDAIVIAAALVGILVAAISFDVPPALFRFAADHAEGKVDDLLFALVILGAALLIYGCRRRVELVSAIALTRSAQERLSRKNRDLDAAVNHMPQGLVMYDRRARLVICNKRYAEMYGLPQEMTTPGHSLESIVAYRIKAAGLTTDARQMAKGIEDTVRAGRPWRTISELADGRSIDVTTTPLRNGGWVATHEDITERRRAERLLRRTETLLISVIENVPAIITMKDTRSLKYVFVNKAGEKYFGMPRSQMVGCAAHDLFSREAADLMASADREVLISGRELFAREYRVDGPDGRQRLVNERRLPIKDDKGDLQCLLSVIADVTDAKWTESA